MKIKILYTLLILAILAACTAAPTPTTAPAPTQRTNQSYQNGKPFRMIVSPKTHPVHKMMIAGFLDACHDLNLLCDQALLLDTVTLDQYIAAMESAVSLGSSGVIMNLGAPVIYTPGEDMAKAFPVVSAHASISKTDIPHLTAWIAADPVAYAKQAAAEMAKATNCTGPIADNQNGSSDQENAVGNSFRDELTRLCPGISILATQMEGVEPATAAGVDAAIIATTPTLKGAFSTTGGGPTSWATALQEANKKPGDVVVISMDYTCPNLQLIKAGWVYALVAQPLYDEFYQGTILLLNALKGEPVTYNNVLPAPIVKLADAQKYIDLNQKAGNECK